MSTVMVLTGCSLCLLACVWCVWRCTTFSDKAEHAATRLRVSQGAISGLIGSVESLDEKWRRLNGRVSALKAQLDDTDFQELPAATPQSQTVTPSGGCENWNVAQAEGPSSAAAHCQCDYCDSRRASRDQMREQLVPKARAKLGAVK